MTAFKSIEKLASDTIVPNSLQRDHAGKGGANKRRFGKSHWCHDVAPCWACGEQQRSVSGCKS